jgi:hypothetical protein
LRLKLRFSGRTVERWTLSDKNVCLELCLKTRWENAPHATTSVNSKQCDEKREEIPHFKAMPESTQQKNRDRLESWKAIETNVLEPGYGLYVPRAYRHF